jgi:aquaporin Z
MKRVCFALNRQGVSSQMNQQDLRNSIAEFIGTFMLVLVGAGAVALNPGNVVVAALAHGLILVAIIATYGHFSNAYVNPAVTLGALVAGKISLRQSAFYWLAQIAGAVVAAGVLRLIIPANFAGATPTMTLGQTLPGSGVTPGMIIVTELVLTFILTSVVFQACIYGKGGSATPLLIGLTLGACILLGGPLTGASLNPARTIGPAFVAKTTQDVTEVMYYIVGPLLGGLLAGFMHSDMFAPEPEVEKVGTIKRPRR